MVAILAPTSQPMSQSTSQPTSQPSAFEQKLAAIDQHSATIHDLTADFVQEKHSPLLRKPLISRGTVRAKEGATLWQTIQPDEQYMSIDPQTLRIYYVKQRAVEEYPIRGNLGMMAASPLPRLEAIRKSFSVQPDDGAGLDGELAPKGGLLAIRMTPTDTTLAQYVDHVRVLLDEAQGLAVAFEMVDPDGETTVMRFSNLKINPNLSDDQFKLNLPTDVKVTRPLEGAGR